MISRVWRNHGNLHKMCALLNNYKSILFLWKLNSHRPGYEFKTVLFCFQLLITKLKI